MSGPPDPEDDDEKTVFLPSDQEKKKAVKSGEPDEPRTQDADPNDAGGTGEDEGDGDGGDELPPAPAVEDEEATRFVPRPSQNNPAGDGNATAVPFGSQPQPTAPPPPNETSAPAPTPSSASGASPDRPPPPPDPSYFPHGQTGATPAIRPVEIGDYVNVFRIERFIARGGMGEVYEAVNPHPPFERVAVKLMLADLASNENALNMFYKESGALGRVHHSSIVQYRIASQSPNGQPYLITEFVNGPSLQQLLGEFRPDEDALRKLTKRLTRGLGAAHAEDVVHRDIAPDNILLAEGNPDRPKIIDFGIVKDSKDGGATIIGDGFAGKLRYVAPEQLGEYDFNVGPWTDIYSLALTMLAVATGAHADMGSSLTDAVRKRERVPDLSAIPESLRPAFEAALQPNPANRPQTMADFAAMLDGAPAPVVPSPIGSDFEEEPEPTATTKPAASEPAKPSDKSGAALPGVVDGSKKWILYGGIGAVVFIALLVGSLIFATSPEDTPETEIADTDRGSEALPAGEAPRASVAEVAQQAIDQVDCAWLTLEESNGSAARFSGGAARPGAVQNALGDAFAASGHSGVAVDTSAVVTFGENLCPLIEALRTARTETPLLDTRQSSYEISMQEARSAGNTERKIAKPLLTVTGLVPGDEAMLLYVEDREAGSFISGRDAIRQVVEGYGGQYQNNGFTVAFEYEGIGGHGIILVSGPPPFSGDLFPRSNEVVKISQKAEWPSQFEQAAREKGWKTDILWFRITDDKPD